VRGPNRPSIRRPEKPSERSRPWAIAAGILALITIGIAFLGTRILQGRTGPTSGLMLFLLILLGLIALALVLIAAFYSARKRLLQERVGGTMMAWLKGHIYLGGLALLAALVHWFLFPLGGGLTSGKLALLLLFILVVSGAGWRFVYLKVPPKVPGDTGNLSIRDTRDRVSDYRIGLDKSKVGKSPTFQQAVDDLLTGTRSPAELQQLATTFDEVERLAWERVDKLARGLAFESIREAKQRRYSRTLQAWRAAHIPLAALLLVAIAFHLYGVFNVGRAFSSEIDQQFASANDCASCHAEIVDEWRLSAHRNAQTSTIMRAQTLMALQENPEFRKDCVNCHAPIGTKFTESQTFPLDEDPGLNPTSAGTEGITCVVCHTMEEHPDELAGFGDDLPIGERSALRLGTMFGPPLEEPGPRPNSAHDSETGFMTDEIASSQMCGACHNVVADVDGNGIAPVASDAAPSDSDGNRVLDENEIDAETDLVLQTTFDEWEDFLFERGGTGDSCVGCHMPPGDGPISGGSPLLGSSDRDRNRHVFVGVDYELDADYYEQPGMPSNSLQTVLLEREKLLRSAVQLEANIPPPEDGVLTATVKLKNLTGHSFPTGFAFARQFWLDISAETASGQPVCLLALDNIPSPCASGKITSESEDLKTCDVQPVGAGNTDVRLIASFPREDCDPWLVNFQKILTDADVDADGVFQEVPFQSKTGGVVKDRVRTVADPETGEAQVMDEIPQGRSARFGYQFEVSGVQNESISVRIVLRHRHLAPYFVRALDQFLEEDEPSADELLQNMTVVDIASNDPLGERTTSPDPETLARRARRAGFSSAVRAAGSYGNGKVWSALPVFALVAGVSLVAASRRRRRYRNNRGAWLVTGERLSARRWSRSR
jgi:nitrate/TMAO reductase-like tetraheme cytochrome c subunit